MMKNSKSRNEFGECSLLVSVDESGGLEGDEASIDERFKNVDTFETRIKSILEYTSAK